MRARLALILAAVLLVVITAGSLYYARQQALEAKGYKAQAETLTTQLAASQARLARVQRSVKAAEQKAATGRQEVQDALDQAPDWSGAAVPAPVASGLCKHVRCK